MGGGKGPACAGPIPLRGLVRSLDVYRRCEPRLDAVVLEPALVDLDRVPVRPGGFTSVRSKGFMSFIASTLPDESMKAIESGMEVFFIQNGMVTSCLKSKSIPESAARHLRT